MNVLIIGCGDTGERLARLHETAGNTVRATTRSAERRHKLQTLKQPTDLLDLDHPPVNVQLPPVELIYMLVPPGGNGSHDPRMATLLRLIEQVGLPQRFVYISTTGVYGDCDGNWVTEASPRQPHSQRAWRRAAAEQQLEIWASRMAVELVILRVPGIYGPDRLPIARLERGDPVLHADEAPWSNRIHIDDLASACVLAGTCPEAHGVYNVTDGQPTTMTDYFNQVADACGLARPPQISRAEAEERFSANMLSFLNESRRIDNSRLLKELGLQLKYPDLAAGLAASLANPSP